MRTLHRCLVIVLASVLAPGLWAAPPDPLLDKDPAGRLASALHRLARTEEQRTQPDRRDARLVDARRGGVTVVAELRAEQAGPSVAAFILSQGGRGVTTAGGLLRADLPPAALRAVSLHPDVMRLRRPHRAEPAGIVSAGVALLRADAYVARTGADGSGVKVGILDVDFKDVDRLIGRELPADVVITESVRTVPDDDDDYGHGNACAEIVHDMAPGASLVLAKVGDDVSFLQALQQLQAHQVDVVSASISFPNVEAPDGRGWFAWHADLAAAESVWINSAGNYAESQHESVATDTDGDGLLEFAGTEMVPLDVRRGGSWVSVRWNELRAQAGEDYDLLVVTEEFRTNPAMTLDNPAVVAVSTDPQDGDDWPYEWADFSSEEDRRLYAVVVRRGPLALPSTRRFSIMTRGRVDLAFRTPAGSISTPADGRRVLATAAIDLASGGLRGYSSRGPSVDGRVKPDLAGPDGVETATHYLFTGTSAAAPHVAGAAALILSREPALTAAELRERVLSSAGFPTQTPNNDVGYGLVNLDRLP